MNKQITLECTDYTTLQQVRTMLTATKTVAFTGEDPGWDDWKKFEQALAKAVAYERIMADLTAQKKKKQTAKANKRADKAKKEHKESQKEAIKTVNKENEENGDQALKHDPASGKSEDEWRDDTVKKERAQERQGQQGKRRGL